MLNMVGGGVGVLASVALNQSLLALLKVDVAKFVLVVVVTVV